MPLPVDTAVQAEAADGPLGLLDQQPKARHWVAALTLMALIGAVDYLTRLEGRPRSG